MNWIDTGAEFHDLRRRRVQLWRQWEYTLPELVVIGMNPSMAGEVNDDATVTRLRNRAERMALGGLRVLNVMDLIETDSKRLHRKVVRLCSDRNREVLRRAVGPETGGSVVLAAWGAEGYKRSPDAAEEVIQRAEEHHVTVWCLGKNADGTPKHPLYLPSDGWSSVKWFAGAPPF